MHQKIVRLKQLWQLEMPIYAFVIFVFCFALWSMMFPQFGTSSDTFAASFGSSVSVSSSIATHGKVNLLYANNLYYAAFTDDSSISGEDAVYISTSTDGSTWSTPVEAYQTLGTGDGVNDPNEFGFVYNETLGEFAITALHEISPTEHDIEFVTSSDGSVWSATSTIVDDTGGLFVNPVEFVPITYNTSTGMYAMGWFSGGIVTIATSSDGGSWNTSTVVASAPDFLTEYGAEAKVVALQVSGSLNSETYQVIYDSANSTTVSYEVMYASSTDGGVNWTTTTISGNISSPSSELHGFDNVTRAGFDTNGNPGVLYMITTNYVSGGGGAASGTMVYASRNSNSSWTTSTIGSANISPLSGATRLHGSGLTMYSSEVPALVYQDASSGSVTLEFFAQTTNTAFSDTDSVAASSVNTIVGNMGIAYNSSSQEIAMLYIEDSIAKFTTSTLRDPEQNTTPSVTIDSFVTTTEGDGTVNVTTTIADADSNEVVRLFIEHSIDNGSTWNSSTLTTASYASGGSLSSDTGYVANVEVPGSDRTVMFTWSSASDVANDTVTTTRIRVYATDWYDESSAVQTAAFTVDNEAPALPDYDTVTSTATTVTLTWTEVSDASTYSVSSTAGDLITTSNTGTSYSSLTPNTQYTFGLVSTDSYGNNSSTLQSTSTYTTAAVPSSVSASSGGTTSVTVSWNANSNASGTVYEVYNTTDDEASATTTATSLTVTGLTANTSYGFKVRAQNLSDNSTYSSYSATSTVSTDAVASESSSSSNGAGYVISNPSPPTISITPSSDKTTEQLTDKEKETQAKGMSINAGAKSTDTRTVTLNMDISGATQMAVSNDSEFTGVGFEPYASSKIWELAEGSGVKTVYVRLRSHAGGIIDVSDTIILTAPGLAPTAEQEKELEVVESVEDTCALTENKAYKHLASNAVYYVTSDCTKRKFQSADVYFSYFTSWAAVNIVPKTTLDSIPMDFVTHMPLKGNDIDTSETEKSVEVATCALTEELPYKLLTSNVVYYVTPACTKKKFQSEQVFFSHFASWSAVIVTDKTVLESIPDDDLIYMKAK